MPYKDPDPTDPNMLVGVMLPADAEATRDMAYVFAEEFARLGYSREQLLWLFKNPFYGGAHGAYRSLGEAATLTIIDECIAAWGGIKLSVQEVQSVQNDQSPLHSSPRRGGRESEARTMEPSENDLNGAKRLNHLNDLNTSDERSEKDA